MLLIFACYECTKKNRTLRPVIPRPSFVGGMLIFYELSETRPAVPKVPERLLLL